MDTKDIIEITRQANEVDRAVRHENMNAGFAGRPMHGQIPSFDAVFLALAFAKVAEAAKGATQAAHAFAEAAAEHQAPQWLQDAITAHRGREVTAGQLWAFGGQGPVTKRDARHVGQWLRMMGYAPTRKGGKILFRL